MSSLSMWLLRLICQHPHTIMRWRDGRMGLECTACFHWIPILCATSTENLSSEVVEHSHFHAR
jgi:hypothetical protein